MESKGGVMHVMVSKAIARGQVESDPAEAFIVQGKSREAT